MIVLFPEDKCRLPKMVTENDGLPREELYHPNDQGGKVLDPKIDAAVTKRFAETEKARHDEAKLISADIARNTVLPATKQNGDVAKAKTDETSNLLRNVCRILDRG